MKKIILLLSLPLFLLSINTEKGDLFIELENIKAEKGSLRIALYEEHNFMDDEEVSAALIVSSFKSGTTEIRLEDIDFGTYAVAVYHDVNDNNKLDKSVLGIPKEPYAFSNNPKIKWKGPVFEESKFTFSSNGQKLRLELKKWKEY